MMSDISPRTFPWKWQWDACRKFRNNFFLFFQDSVCRKTIFSIMNLNGISPNNLYSIHYYSSLILLILFLMSFLELSEPIQGNDEFKRGATVSSFGRRRASDVSPAARFCTLSGHESYSCSDFPSSVYARHGGTKHSKASTEVKNWRRWLSSEIRGISWKGQYGEILKLALLGLNLVFII